MELPCIMEEAENSPYIRPSVAAYTGVLIFQACCAVFSSVGRNMCICIHLYLNTCMAVIYRSVPKGRLPSRCKCTAIGCIACGPAQKNCCQQPTDRQTNPPGLKAGKWGYSESARAICERVYERKQVSLYLMSLEQSANGTHSGCMVGKSFYNNEYALLHETPSRPWKDNIRALY